MKWVLRVAGALAGLTILAVGLLAALGARKDSNRLYHAIVLPAPPNEVWPWLHEPERIKKWVSWVESVEPESPQPMVGTKSKWVMRDANNNNQRMEIMTLYREVEPHKRLRVRSSSGDAFEGDASYVLTDLGGGQTRLEAEARYEMHSWFFKLLMPIVVPQAQKKLEMDCEALKQHMASSKTEYTRN
ncbi:MAG: SRPBCC family protein [Bryobacteraceae bacterium]|nr:SRPBCC family protein [Bryobacteraceae bacterium]